MNRIIWTTVGMLLALTVGVVAAPRIKSVFVANTVGHPIPVEVVAGLPNGDAEPEMVFAGYTSAEVTTVSHPSIHDWHAECAADFDGGRVATLQDYFNADSPPLPLPSDLGAWVFPSVAVGCTFGLRDMTVIQPDGSIESSEGGGCFGSGDVIFPIACVAPVL